MGNPALGKLENFEPELAQGRLLIHTGMAKGKSTAAYGAALRAFGHRQQHGKKVGIYQFIKDEHFPYGERQVLRDIGIELVPLGDGCSLRGQDPDGSRQLAIIGWGACQSGASQWRLFFIGARRAHPALAFCLAGRGRCSASPEKSSRTQQCHHHWALLPASLARLGRHRQR